MSNQSACFSQYTSATQERSYGMEELIPVDYAGIDWGITMTRPFIPLWVLKKDVAGNRFPSPIIFVQPAFIDFSQIISEQCYEASVNKVNGGGTITIQTGDYDQYLYKKLFSVPSALPIYRNIYRQVYTFWKFIDPANTNQQYLNQLQTLLSELKNAAMEQYFIAPGIYRATALNPYHILITAMKAADPDFIGFQCLTLNS